MPIRGTLAGDCAIFACPPRARRWVDFARRFSAVLKMADITAGRVRAGLLPRRFGKNSARWRWRPPVRFNWSREKETIFVRDFGKAIYPAALAAAPDLPDQVSAWALEMSRRKPCDAELKAKIAEYRQRKAREHEEKIRTGFRFIALVLNGVRACRPFIPSGRRLPFWPLGPQGRVDRQFSEVARTRMP